MNKLLLLSFLLIQNFAATNSHAQIKYLKKLCARILYGAPKASDDVSKAASKAKKGVDNCVDEMVDVQKVITSRGVKNFSDEAITATTKAMQKHGSKMTKEQLQNSYTALLKILDNNVALYADKIKAWKIAINNSTSSGSIFPAFTTASEEVANQTIKVTGSNFSRFARMVTDTGVKITTPETYTQSLYGLQASVRITNTAGEVIAKQDFWIKYSDEGMSGIDIIPVYRNGYDQYDYPIYKVLDEVKAVFSY